MLLGRPAEGGCFAPSSQILCIDGPFLVLRMGTTAGPPSPIHLKRHWGKQGFLLRCRWLPFTEWELSPGLGFFWISCSYCGARFVDVRSPARARISPNAGLGDWAGLDAQPCNQEGSEGRKSRPQSRWPPGGICSGQLRLGRREAAWPRHWGVPVTRRTCGRIICTWGCDNTNVWFFLKVIRDVCKVHFIFL